MIFDQKKQSVTKHSCSYGADQSVYFWGKMAILGQRIIRKEV